MPASASDVFYIPGSVWRSLPLTTLRACLTSPLISPQTSGHSEATQSTSRLLSAHSSEPLFRALLADVPGGGVGRAFAAPLDVFTSF